MPAAAQLPEEHAIEYQSRFQRTVLYLQDTSTDEQADFTAAALSQLAEVYMAEADLARAEASRSQGKLRAKLLGWSIAVDQYANQLVLLMEDLEQGFPVALLQGREGAVTVSVAGRMVILSHPRADQQAAYEQRVLAEFCGSNDCRSMTVVADQPEPIPVTTARVNPVWTFTEKGQLCTGDTIEIRFTTIENLGLLRSICAQLLQELSALAAELAWQARHGVEVDWSALTITATPGRPEHLVRLNGAGDSILLTVPLLFGNQNLLQDSKPWLRDRASGGESATMRLDAAKYGLPD